MHGHSRQYCVPGLKVLPDLETLTSHWALAKNTDAPTQDLVNQKHQSVL